QAGSPLTIAVMDSHSVFGAALLAQLRRDLPAAQCIEIDDTAGDDQLKSLQPADLIVLPLPTLLGNAGLSSMVAATTARVLIVPLADSRISVAGQSSALSIPNAVAQTLKWIQQKS
ncbi:MAG: hypothetical protein HYR71_10520, partial [Chloroflexi bacterium]|nr:hypothetical protein [Chloroflexota bacterium]